MTSTLLVTLYSVKYFANYKQGFDTFKFKFNLNLTHLNCGQLKFDDSSTF